MTDGPLIRVSADRHPWWVKFCTWTGHSRTAQWMYLWLSVAAAIICIAVLNLIRLPGITFAGFAIGAIGFWISAVWYWLAIRWIDRNGTWPQ